MSTITVQTSVNVWGTANNITPEVIELTDMLSIPTSNIRFLLLKNCYEIQFDDLDDAILFVLKYTGEIIETV